MFRTNDQDTTLDQSNFVYYDDKCYKLVAVLILTNERSRFIPPKSVNIVINKR